MAKRLAHLLIVAALIPALVSCGSDSTTEPPCAACDYPQTRDDVLVSLALSYDERNLDEFTRLLADDFVFYFSAADVRDGNVEVSQWDREKELMATTGIFERPPSMRSSAAAPGAIEGSTWGRVKALYSDGPGDYLAPVGSITLTLNYPEGEDAWTPIEPEGTNETLYSKTFEYLLTVVAGETTYTSGRFPIDAMITVRPVTIDGTTVWQIVDWRDDI